MFDNLTNHGLKAIIVSSVLALTGCIGGGDGLESASLLAKDFEVRHTISDSMVEFAVDSMQEDMTYDDLLILVDNQPFKFGQHLDLVERLFEVEGKDEPGDHVRMGDVIRVPVAGHVTIELRHAPSGLTIQQLQLIIPDETAPTPAELALPSPGAQAEPRQTVFQWDRQADASGIQFVLEYWVNTNGIYTQSRTITSIDGTSYAVPQSESLLPSTNYRWHVRAIDGAGNAGAWSDTWEFTTST